jgi:hypothetical protein
MRTSFVALNANAHSFTALRTYQHHVRYADGALVLNPTRIQIPATLGLNLFLVLGADIDALDGNAAFISEYIDHFPAFTLVFQAPSGDFYCIAFANFDFHYFRSCAG